ncbi:MAG: tRNA preQ1(34) S-adenosylmethionine ribosyltransferase-isomerase QueA [Polyangiales bacterium]
MRIDLLDFTLPAERIAQQPAETRDGARMLVVEPHGPFEVGLRDAAIVDLPRELPSNALLVVNDTQVIPARLFAKKPETGGKVEIFLVRREGPGFYERKVPGADGEETTLKIEGEVWRALGKSSKPLRFDQDLEVGEDLSARILGRSTDDGLLRVLLMSTRSIDAAVDDYGHVPLPPYIKRVDEPGDIERYQTVFARQRGSVAAPTAGLHLSTTLLGRLAIAGIELCTVTLHVGLGTFQPVQVDDLDAHPMHAERYAVSRATAEAVNKAKREGRPVFCVGTTAVRAIETAARIAEERGSDAAIVACEGETRLLLQPGERLRVVDGLLTNFHLPKSTLLALVATFLGVENVHTAYAHAVAREYRFYSYGDAMLIKRALAPEAALASVDRRCRMLDSAR